MTVDIYSTNYLQGVISRLKTPATFFTRRYFGRMTQDQSEDIHFDILNKRRRLAPYVAPLSPAGIVASNGFTTSTFKPAYTKDIRPINPAKALKRAVGERLGGGQLSAIERQKRRIVIEVEDQVEMIHRTKEAQAVEALRTGGITVEGVDYPLANISFGRNAANDIALTGGDQWTDASSKPIQDLRNAHGLILKNGGGSARDVVMDVDAWDMFTSNSDVQQRLDSKSRMNESISEDVADTEGVAYQGTMDGFNFFTYEEWVEDENGDDQPHLQSGEVLLLSQSVEGIQAHGAIVDEAADLMPLEYFPSSWVEKNPSIRQVMMQSSFLMVPTRINGCARITVK